MFIIDVNKTKSILYIVFLWYPLLALPLSSVIFYSTTAAANTARHISVSLKKKYSEWKETGSGIPFLLRYNSVRISAYHMTSNPYDVLMGFANNLNNTHDKYKIQIVACAGTDNIAIWCIFDDMTT
jgi:hypothetical protein